MRLWRQPRRHPSKRRVTSDGRIQTANMDSTRSGRRLRELEQDFPILKAPHFFDNYRNKNEKNTFYLKSKMNDNFMVIADFFVEIKDCSSNVSLVLKNDCHSLSIRYLLHFRSSCLIPLIFCTSLNSIPFRSRCSKVSFKIPSIKNIVFRF